MLKKKRLIILILSFLFTFNSFFYTPKAIENYTLEPTTSIQPREPITITLTTGLILAICTVLTACGVVITTPDMARDMAQRVYDGVKDIPGAITQVGDKVKFNIVKGVLDVIKSVVASLPDDSISYDGPESTVTSPSIPNSSKPLPLPTLTVNSTFRFTTTKTVSRNDSPGVTFRCKHKSSGYVNSSATGGFLLPTSLPAGDYYIRFYTELKDSSSGKSIALKYRLCNSSGEEILNRSFTPIYSYFSDYRFSDFTVEFTHGSYFADTFSISNVIDIPYSPDTTQDVDYDTKPQEWFPSLDSPVFGGSISAPIDQPLPDISIDVPWTSPNDFVADNDISIDATDTSLPDNSVDSDSVLDKILSAILGFFTTFWDNFLSFLDGLLAPIVGLLQFIYDLLKPIIGFFGDILKFLGDILSAILDGVIGAIGSLVDLLTGILDFLLSLVDALIDALVGALEGLFVPTIDLSEAFSIPENVFVPFHEFEFDDLFSITPKPIRFSTTITFGSIVYPIKLYFDEVSVISDNIGLIRNIFSYTLLLASIYSAIAIFLPKRVMD